MGKINEGINETGFNKAFLKLFMDTNDILWVCDIKSGRLYLSDRFSEITGFCAWNEIVSMQDLFDIIHPSDRRMAMGGIGALLNKSKNNLSVEFRLISRNGDVKHIFMRGSLNNGKNDQGEADSIQYAAGTITDTSAQRNNEKKLNQMTYYDSLTHLPNRSMFIYKTTAIIRQKAENPGLCAIAYIDIDNFKRINDTYGHYFGDDVLKQVGNSISAFLKQDALIARLGGDEFLLLFPEVKDRHWLASRLEKLHRYIAKAMLVGGQEICITCSAGVAIYPMDGVNAEDLIKNADAAMYCAKDEGKNKSFFYEQAINTVIVKRTEMENHLRGALEKGEFELVYQPQLDMKSGRISGLEALLRWHSPVYGTVSPLEFIPIAEESGLIIPIGLWVLQEVCIQNKQWQEDDVCQLPVYVNISPVQLKDERLFFAISNILHITGLHPEYLRIEITENIFVDNFIHAVTVLKKIRNKGIQIALDDFGTGYSSLNYLKSLPLDVLKIDKSFVKDLKDGKKEKAIAETIVSLAHILNMSVVAEGVETREQFEYLRKIGCNLIQGYYISKPLPVKDIGKVVKELCSDKFQQRIAK